MPIVVQSCCDERHKGERMIAKPSIVLFQSHPDPNGLRHLNLPQMLSRVVAPVELEQDNMEKPIAAASLHGEFFFFPPCS